MGDALSSSDSDLPLHSNNLTHGCQHYRRKCKIRAPCCDQVYTCRHCHNEAVGALEDAKKHHELVRQDVRQVICMICDAEQPVAQVCTNCGVTMGEYFCDICKFYDDETSKEQFHCHDCGICRVGGKDNFFHCKKCGSCYSNGLLDNHSCVENSMQHHCSICYEYLFDSTKGTRVLKCGHTMHEECFHEMILKNQYTCPLCFKSILDMSRNWELLENEVQAITMPEDYRDKKVWILCNDCNQTSEVFFHIVGLQCRHCRSFNTRNISAPAVPQ